VSIVRTDPCTVNSFIFADPVSGNWYIYVGDYPEGYAARPSRCVLLRSTDHPRSVKYKRAREKPNSYVQPSVFDILAGESPASARDGWAE
jgi:hypothetical protein